MPAPNLSNAGPAASSSSSSDNAPKPPVKPPVVQPGGTGNTIIVNPCQRLNPILEHVKNVGKEFGDIVSDFQVGRTTGVLFLSLKYHRLHPEYIHQRIEKLGHSYNLRVLLLMCDVSEHQEPIRELTKTCLINNITIVVAWTPEEAGTYLSTYKQFEHKPPTMIKERVEKDYLSLLRTSLTSISKVNKTDVETLRTSIGSIADIARATSDQLSNLPGFGQVKVKRIKDAFEKPFRNNATSILSYAQAKPTPNTSRAESEGQSQGVAHSESYHGVQVDGRSGTTDQGNRKGKERATTPSRPGSAPEPVSRTTTRTQRSPSPVWDIELDLNASPSPEPQSHAGPGPSTSSAKPSMRDVPTPSAPRPRPEARSISKPNDRHESPAWDIELDLNASPSPTPSPPPPSQIRSRTQSNGKNGDLAQSNGPAKKRPLFEDDLDQLDLYRSSSEDEGPNLESAEGKSELKKRKMK